MTTTARPQLLLPGQAAAPEGPIDLTPMFVMHAGFRRDLRAFSAASEATPVHDRRTWAALQRRWQRFSMVLHHHHSGEDAGIWPLLVERSAAVQDVAALEVLTAMSAEHEQIDPLLEAIADDLGRLARMPDDDARAALEVRLVAAEQRLGAHLAHEEQDALVIVQRRLTEQDWARIDEEHFARTATPRYVAYVVPWVLHQLPDEGRRRLRSAFGRSALLLEPLLRPSFLRLERAAFRHVD